MRESAVARALLGRTGMHRDGRLTFTLEFRPSMAGVSATREFVSTVAAQHIADPRVISRIAITVHELLENIVKYSTDGIADLTVDVLPHAAGASVSVGVRSRGKAAHLPVLRRVVQEISEASDPWGYYCDLLRRTARLDESGLGIARICAEADMSLRASFDGEEVHVLAHATVVTNGEPHLKVGSADSRSSVVAAQVQTGRDEP